MSQTDIRNSNQYQQAPVKMRPSHSSAAEFHFPSEAEEPTTISQMLSCHDLSVLSNSKLSRFLPSLESFSFFLAGPTSPGQWERSVEATASNFLRAHVGASVGVCVFPLRLL